MYIRTIFQSFLQALVSHINSISTSSSDAVRLIPSERVNRFSCSRLVIIMNGMNGIPALWQEARNTDGRIYYYNVQTKATQWTKPFELMTPAEVSIFFADLSAIDRSPACLGKPAMEGIHCGWWSQILVQHRDETKHLGNAGSL